MKTVFVTLPVVFLAAACTHGAVSNVPLEVQGVGTVYRYQGRANFSHQIAEADKMMTEHCKAVNGGRPVVVDLQKRDLGVGVMSSGTANTNVNANVTSTGYPNQARVTGTANTTSTSTVAAMRNMNQEILYKCVKE
jgi:hypothetical protein